MIEVNIFYQKRTLCISVARGASWSSELEICVCFIDNLTVDGDFGHVVLVEVSLSWSRVDARRYGLTIVLAISRFRNDIWM
uniref:Uncharacterized protein n=1 Tax=Arundo donax TaxID=35708 RepID=A0A0A9HL60_ARUDO